MANAAQISEYDEVIDARTPAEYAQDHIPGAINVPALSNTERAEIGTLHRADPFLARQRGAAHFIANLSQHLGGVLADRPPTWTPLVYCARGGQRSGGMVEVLRRIGWQAEQLHGGYKAYRQYVLATLQHAARHCRWCVIAGKTGTGKTRLLTTLRAHGAQVVNLEEAAAHRGSVFGAQDTPQPTQRNFETRLCAQLENLNPNQVTYIEAEGRKVGALHTPAPLLAAMRAARVIRIETPLPQRVAHLLSEYASFSADAQKFEESLEKLRPFAGNTRLEHWQERYRAGAIGEVVEDLLANFYDIGYEKSLTKNYARVREAQVIEMDPTSEGSVGKTVNSCQLAVNRI